MKKIFSFSLVVITISLIFTACSGSGKSRSLIESVSSFLNGNETIIGFGSARLGEILDKTDYKSEAKINAILSEPLGQLKSSLNMEQPVYFAIEGPFIDGNPVASYLFMEIKNQDSLKANLTKNGFELKEDKEFHYLQDGDLNLAFNETIAIAVVKSDVEDTKAALKAIFEKTKGDVSTGYIADILNKKDDLVYGASLANLYGTSNTDLEDLSPEKQKELRSMLQNSYVETGLRFEDGAIVLETKNYFSDALKGKLFLNKDSGAKILSNLGSGKPTIGVSLNIDTKKLQEFLNEYAPNALEDLSEDIGGPFAMAMMLANNDISKLIDGRIAALVVGDATKVAEGMTPDFNFFIGFGGQGKMFGGLLKELFADRFGVIKLWGESGISAYSSSAFSENGKISLPEGAENFGKDAFNLFIDLSSVDLEEFQLDGGAKMVELVKYISANYGTEGGKVIIKARDGKENILKQAFNKALKVFEDELAI
jgi:hypothetical protein